MRIRLMMSGMGGMYIIPSIHHPRGEIEGVKGTADDAIWL